MDSVAYYTNTGITSAKQYIWVPVNVTGIVAVVGTFVPHLKDIIHDTVISKCWMRRVKAIEDRGESIHTIQGKDGIKRLIQEKETELIDKPAEEEMIRLADELDGYDYLADQGKTSVSVTIRGYTAGAGATQSWE